MKFLDRMNRIYIFPLLFLYVYKFLFVYFPFFICDLAVSSLYIISILSVTWVYMRIYAKTNNEIFLYLRVC